MDKRITFVTTEEIKEAIEQYCEDRTISVSSFIKDLVVSKLIEEKYLKGGKLQ